MAAQGLEEGTFDTSTATAAQSVSWDAVVFPKCSKFLVVLSKKHIRCVFFNVKCDTIFFPEKYGTKFARGIPEGRFWLYE